MKLSPSGSSPDISSNYKDPPKTISDCQKQIGNRELQAGQHLILDFKLALFYQLLLGPSFRWGKHYYS